MRNNLGLTLRELALLILVVILLASAGVAGLFYIVSSLEFQ